MLKSLQNLNWILVAVFIGLGLSGQVEAKQVKTGPIWSNDHAKKVCPKVCNVSNRAWNGHWKTIKWNKLSVCTCKPKCKAGYKNAGNIKNKAHAKTRCPKVCKRRFCQWTGSWKRKNKKNKKSKKSVCECKQ